MISVLSPAKTLDFETPYTLKNQSIPLYPEKSALIMKKLAGFSAKKLATLMDISASLAEQNLQRNKLWNTNFEDEDSKPAILAFKGDVYLGLEAASFTEKDFAFAQQHLLILSGLHGCLRPLDRIKPYRLEMGTSIAVGKSANLYAFWKDTVTHYIQSSLESHKEKILINLASNEYFKVIDTKKVQVKIIHCEFKDLKEGNYKMIGFFAKKARGYMASYIAKNKIDTSNDVKSFSNHGYVFNKKLSSETHYIFTRDKPE